jgi:hypothetical protein
MWFKVLLSRIFKYDITARRLTEAEHAEAQRLIDEGVAQGWIGDCGLKARSKLGATGGTHYCCDSSVSFLSCSQRNYACQGHYGVCCSNC